jgi:hypothetical protein
MSGPVQVPSGEHHLQVRCGAQSSWLMRLDADGRPRTLRIPVRAMLAARGDTETGGIVLVDPGERDSAVLVDLVSEATGLAGAGVARTATAKVEFGRWEAGMSGPTVDNVGAIDGGYIVSVRRAGGNEGPSGRVWTWVTGGVGLAALGGAIATNVVYEDERSSGSSDEELSGLQAASTALYIAGGALLVTSVILFFVEGGEGQDRAARFGSSAPGLVHVRF